MTHPPARKPRQLLIRGMRRSGQLEFDLEISGNPASELPPVNVKMTLTELQSWLRHGEDAPEQPRAAAPKLRAV